MKQMKHIRPAVLASAVIGLTLPISAAEPTIEEQIDQSYAPSSTATGLLVGKLVGETAMDRAWSAFTLYKDESNPILQEFALKGRLQVQSIYGKSDGDSFNTSDHKAAGNNDAVWGNDIEARRARLAFKSKWFKNWKFEGTFNVDTDGQDNAKGSTFYRDLYDLYISYAPSDAMNVSVGKTKVRFTREQEISSNDILTVERSLISNTLFPGELTGVWVNGKGIQDYWLYEAGVYGADRTREFSSFDDGEVFLAKIGYDYSSQMGFDSAVASLHFMHNTNPGFREAGTSTSTYRGSASPNFENSFALTNDMTQGRFGLTTDITFAQGNGTQSDVMGISLIPSYYIADGLQLVGRLQVATSKDSNDLQVPSRYERLAKLPSGANDDETGDTYTSAYIGLNYFIYGHKLKLVNGIEYSQMGGGDYSGYTIMSGLRFSF
jgi:phosphate-selective porin OprO/OprP